MPFRAARVREITFAAVKETLAKNMSKVLFFLKKKCEQSRLMQSESFLNMARTRCTRHGTCRHVAGDPASLRLFLSNYFRLTYQSISKFSAAHKPHEHTGETGTQKETAYIHICPGAMMHLNTASTDRTDVVLTPTSCKTTANQAQLYTFIPEKGTENGM